MKQPGDQLKLNLGMILGTVLLHGVVMSANELLFRKTEFMQGIGWIYIPAGSRLLCTLLFGWAGAVGLIVAGWIACFWYYFPGDVLRSTSGAIAGAMGPYLVYLAARHQFGWRSSLTDLTPYRLLLCALGCAFASPLLHHVWFALHGDSNLLPGFLVMFTGDLLGTLIVLYTAKWVLSRMPGAATAS